MIHRAENAVLMTAFRNSSAELLLNDARDYKTLILPNDKIRDSEMLIEAVSNEKFDYIISIGQRPNIKNKVHIETTAREGTASIGTNCDCAELARLFNEVGISTKISCNAGTSYCNRLYLNGLRYLSERQQDTQMVFVHIPYKKNITDFGLFRSQFFRVVAYIRNHQEG